jgi:hypothetical protein
MLRCINGRCNIFLKDSHALTFQFQGQCGVEFIVGNIGCMLSVVFLLEAQNDQMQGVARCRRLTRKQL